MRASECNPLRSVQSSFAFTFIRSSGVAGANTADGGTILARSAKWRFRRYRFLERDLATECQIVVVSCPSRSAASASVCLGNANSFHRRQAHLALAGCSVFQPLPPMPFDRFPPRHRPPVSDLIGSCVCNCVNHLKLRAQPLGRGQLEIRRRRI